jgi:hypothetical protein
MPTARCLWYARMKRTSTENYLKANFLELRACELLRMPLPRTRVNKGKR